MKTPAQNVNGQQSKNGEIFLEPHTQTEDSPQSRSILVGQLRESYGRVVYSHKTQEKCADLLLEKLGWIKFWQISLSALTTAGFIGAACGAGTTGAVIGGAVSVVLLTLNAYTKNYDLGEIAQKHRQAAAELWLIREKYLNLLVDLEMKEKPLESLQSTRDELVQQLYETYKGAPSTNSKAYQSAQNALQHLEDMTFSDEEIDAFLPKVLKRGKATENKSV